MIKMIAHIISSSVLIVAIWIVSFLMEKKMNPCIKYALWLLVVIKLLVPLPGFESDISVMNAVEKITPSQVSYLFVESEIEQDSVYDNHKIQNNQSTTTDQETSLSHSRFSKYLLGIWIIGVLLCAGIFLWSNIQLARTLRKKRLWIGRIKNRLSIYQSTGITSPCLFGLIKPCVYLPENIRLSERQRKYVLIHEYTHFRHGDQIWALIRCICIVLYWYNPLVWIAAMVSIKDSELACDYGTLKQIGTNEQILYGRTLIEIAKEISDKTLNVRLWNCSTSAAGGMREMKKRVQMIARQPKTTIISLILLGIVCIGIVGCAFGSAVTSEETVSIEDIAQQDPILEEPQTKVSAEQKEAEEGAWYETQTQQGLMYGQIPLYEQRDEEKVCIKVEPSVLRANLFYYYIPTGELQEQLTKLVQQNLKGEPSEARWFGKKESGWQIYYQELILTAFEDGYFYVDSVNEEGSYTEYLIQNHELYQTVQNTLEETVGYQSFDPANIKEIVSAKLEVCSLFTNWETHSQTITDPETLRVFAELFSNAEYLFGGADCGNQCSCLELTLTSGEVIKLSVATDSCTNFGINGVYYDYRPEKYRKKGGWYSYDFYAYFDKISGLLEELY